MGRVDPKQKKLAFDKPDGSERSASFSNRDDAVEAAGPAGGRDGTTTIMEELRAGFRAIDARFNTLNSRLDRMGERLDNHHTRLGEAEQRISDQEDHTCELTRRLKRVERVLKTVAIKNEDLEARSRRNNICAAGLAESTNIGRPEIFMENLLKELFGAEAFTQSFVVEPATVPWALVPYPAPLLNQL